MLCLYAKARYLGLCFVFLLFFDFCFFFNDNCISLCCLSVVFFYFFVSMIILVKNFSKANVSKRDYFKWLFLQNFWLLFII